MTAREAVLEEQVKELRASLEQVESQREKLEKLNKELRQRIDELSRRLFGRSSEKLNKDQFEFLFDCLKDTPPPPPGPETNEEGKPDDGKPGGGKKRRKPTVKTPSDIEVVEEYLIPERVRANPEQWKEIDREILKQLDYIPSKFLMRLTIRPKYVAINDREIAPLIEPAPPRVIDRGGATPRLMAHLISSKYIDHQPYYRLEKMFFERHQVWIPRQQMTQWDGKCLHLLESIYNLIKDEVRAAIYLQIDETPIRFLDRTNPKGSALGYLWTYLVPGSAVVFDWRKGRSTDALREFLENSAAGKIQCDGYSAYDTYGAENPDVALIGCWAHARRKFDYAKKQDSAIAGEVLNEIGKLYGIERELRNSRAGPEERLRLRKEKSKPIANALHEKLLVFATQLRPSSGLGKAVSYTLGQWSKLSAVFEHSEAELDTNLVENKIRPSAIGKKNWLFVGHRDAGKRAAIFYTLIQTCRMQGVEPYAYLADVLERLPTATNQTVHELTPRAWAQAQAA